MSIWSTLGLESTQDPEAIERAYEHQLRFVDPDASPDDYQRLRRAYEQAMQEAGAAPLDEDFGVDEPTRSEEEPVSRSGIPEAPSPDAELHAGQVMTELESVYSNPGWREDLRRWRAQLESEKAHKPGVTQVLRFRVFEFLARQASPGERPVPQDVLAYLDERLGWSAHRDQLEQAFSHQRVSALLGESESEGSDSGSPLDIEPFPNAGDQGDVPEGMPRGIGFTVIGWVIFLVILTMLFSQMR